MAGDAAALRQMLSAARARISPESFPGLASSLAQRDRRGRRGGGGLTQAQVDTLLGRQPGTYNRLENGRRVNASLLQEVADLLRLDHQEWVALWRYALGREPPRARGGDLAPHVPSTWRLVVDAQPMISYVTDRDWNVLAWNSSAGDLFTGASVPDNTMAWMLTAPHARTVLLEWESRWAPPLMAQLRAAVALHPESATLSRLVEAASADPDARQLYEESGTPGSVMSEAEAPRPLLHPEIGAGWVYLCAADIHGTPGARLMTMPFLPGTSPPAAPPPLGSPGRRLA